VTTPTLGERRADLRRLRGFSERELASEMKLSESWVSQVERDVRPIERLSVLRSPGARSASVFGTCAPTLSPNRATRAPSPTTSTACASNSRGTRTWRALRHSRAGGACRLRRASRGRRQRLGPRPRVAVRSAQRRPHRAASAARTCGARGPGRRREARSCFAPRAYQAAAAAFARQDEADAAWVAADRAISAAEPSGSPLEVIAGHFRLAHAFIRLGRLSQALARSTSFATCRGVALIEGV
jgi:hypothetical protein